jgi:hypothetical protein
MSTFFGIALSPSLMRKKIFDLKPYDVVMVDTVKTLKDSGNFGVAIFDNSQIFQTVKFQRNSQSSTASLATARCFVKPIIPSDINMIPFPNQHSNITYIDQAIPSVYGMPKYEDINDIKADYFFLTKDNLAFDDTINLSGARVNKYCDLATIAYTTHKLRKLIPRDRHNHFHHQKELNSEAIIAMKISEKLKMNWTMPQYTENNYDFYTYMSQFQNRHTKLWRGNIPKTSLLLKLLPKLHTR